MSFKIEIVSPEKIFVSKENVKEVVLPAYEGEMGILKDHISIISFLKPGIIKVFNSDNNEVTIIYNDNNNEKINKDNKSIIAKKISKKIINRFI